MPEPFGVLSKVKFASRRVAYVLLKLERVVSEVKQ